MTNIYYVPTLWSKYIKLFNPHSHYYHLKDRETGAFWGHGTGTVEL